MNTLNKIFQKENLGLTEIGDVIEIRTRSLSRIFFWMKMRSLVQIRNFGVI